MRSLIRQYLDEGLSRRGFIRELGALGVSLASAQTLLASLSDAQADTLSDAGLDESIARIVTGNGSDMIFETFEQAGVKYIFHGCGGGTNRFFDSVLQRPGLKNFLATNEGQAVAMAEGYHIASGGELGVAMIPRPGLMNAGGNIHNAMVNRSSMIVLTAREHNKFSNRRGNIELVEWEDVLDPFMKWGYKMQNFGRVPEFTRRAIKVARTPPGGPVFLQMTENLYQETGEGTILPQNRFHVAGGVRAKPELIEQAARMLIEAENPMLVVGLEVTKSGGQAELIELAELLAIPVMQGLSAFADFPSRHELALGWFTRFSVYMRKSDLMLLIGSQMPDEGHYVLTGPPAENTKICHISLEPEMLAMAWPTDLSIMADARAAIVDLTEAVKSMLTKRRITAIRAARHPVVTEYIQADRARKLKRAKRFWDRTPITYPRLSTELNDLLDDDAIIVSESLFDVAPWFDVGHGRKLQIGPQPGEVLGWATGVALGAKLAQPDRQVVALSGDGAFMFQNALWSLSRYDAPVLIVIYNNKAYNMNWAFNRTGGGAQARAKKDLATYLGNPDVDYVMWAKSHGIDGEGVTDPGKLRAAIKRGIGVVRDGRPYLLDVHAERWGGVGDYTWHPEISIAGMRTRKV
ncbi:MAG: thiamine pyrophosphate-binding protein [Gammaproteobacteria bacterium]|nr:MAG: thiamine pyrophosphate-binding protein [Gammaproteobacteria bacterium]